MEPETTVKDFCSSLKLISLYIGYVLSIIMFLEPLGSNTAPLTPVDFPTNRSVVHSRNSDSASPWRK